MGKKFGREARCLFFLAEKLVAPLNATPNGDTQNRQE